MKYAKTLITKLKSYKVRCQIKFTAKNDFLTQKIKTQVFFGTKYEFHSINSHIFNTLYLWKFLRVQKV